jgi:PAS domain S-box-containing protein
MIVASPVAPEREDRAAPVAVLVFDLDPARDFTRVTQLGRTGETGETYAFDRNGRLLTESRFDAHLRQAGLVPVAGRGILAIEVRDPGGNMVEGFRPTQPRPLQPLTRMARSAIAGEAGLNLDGYRDYRGVPVVGAWRWDDELGVGLATEIDEAEAYRSLRITRRLVLFMLGATGVGALGVILALARRADALETSLAAQRSAGENLAKLARAVEHTDDAVLITDPHGVIQFVNPAFITITGYGTEEAVGHTPRELLWSGAQDSAFYENLWNTILSGETWRGTLTNRKKSGEHYIADETISAVRDESGAVTHFVAVQRDVTERRRLEAQLEEARRMEALTHLAGGMAGEFNNLLTPILGFSDLLRASLGEEDPRAEQAAEIYRTAERAAELFRQLLLFSGRHTVQVQPVDLNRLVAELEPRLRAALGETVDVRIMTARPLSVVRVDPRQIEAGLLNLALFARQAMPTGGVLTFQTNMATLDSDAVARLPRARPGNYACLTVRDTGRGIPPKVRSRLFEPFFTTKGMGHGEGLGLALLDGIVRQAGGFIEVSDEPGTGTAFALHFPATGDPEPSAARAASANQVGAKAQWGTETILLVDDDDAVRNVAARILRTSGYVVAEAADADDALDAVERYRDAVSLLITDVLMPKMSGRCLAEEVLLHIPEVKVLYISGYSDDALDHGCAGAQGRAFLPKPFTPSELLSCVRRLLDQD